MRRLWAAGGGTASSTRRTACSGDRVYLYPLGGVEVHAVTPALRGSGRNTTFTVSVQAEVGGSDSRIRANRQIGRNNSMTVTALHLVAVCPDPEGVGHPPYAYKLSGRDRAAAKPRICGIVMLTLTRNNEVWRAHQNRPPDVARRPGNVAWPLAGATRPVGPEHAMPHSRAFPGGGIAQTRNWRGRCRLRGDGIDGRGRRAGH